MASPSDRGAAVGYTTREVARLLDEPEWRIRSWVRSGFVTPRRGARRAFRFSFQDLVVLRAAQALAAAEIPPRRVRRALERLRRQLPRGRSLAAVRIEHRGERIVVQEQAEVWEPESGQQLLGFEVSELAERAAPVARAMVVRTGLFGGESGGLESRRGDGRGPEPERAENDENRASADDWFDLALELEATAPEEACRAYRRVLAREPGRADAHLNLGRLLHERGVLAGEDGAEEHYRRALELGPEDGVAAYNLGVALQDQGRERDAVEAYRRAVEAEPGLADAWYNLAGLQQRLGERAAALRSLQTYRRLVGRR